MALARKQVKNLCEPVAVRQISILFSYRRYTAFFREKAIGTLC